MISNELTQISQGCAENQRKIVYLVLHCSAVRPNQSSSAAQIDSWHKARGFCSPSGKHIGYHVVVRRDGCIELGRPISEVGAHASGFNSHSIGICYEGGLDSNGHPADTRTSAQRATLLRLFRLLKAYYPDARIVGHNELGAAKACPCLSLRDISDLRELRDDT